MEQYIIAYSRFIIAFLGAGYAALALASLAVHIRDSSGLTGKALLNGQCIVLFCCQLTGFLTICVETGNIDYLFFYAFSQIVLFACIVLFSMIYPGINRALINHMCFLTGTGFMILTRLDLKKAWKQLLIFAVSLAVSLTLPMLLRRFRKLRDYTWLYAGFGILALAVVLILGSVTHGSKLSYSIAGITFQPSEFVKISFLFFTASACSRIVWLARVGSGDGRPRFFDFHDRSFMMLLSVCAVAAAHVLLLVLSRDLGSALIFFVSFLFLIYFVTGQLRYLGLGALAGCGAALVSYQVFTHVQVRVQAWKDPWIVIDKQGYQITQSLFALGRGGWFGLGIGQGTPKDIPYVETDFVFAAVSEELGILFSVCLLLICVVCFLELMKISAVSEEVFYSILAAGLGIMYIFQVFLTVGGGIKFIPLTGVTLPFISYGGSSIMASVMNFSAAQGVVLRSQDMQIEWNRKQKTKRRRIPEPEYPLTVVLFCGLFSALILYLCTYIHSNSEELFNNSYNSRQSVLAVKNTRGTIFAADGEILAETVPKQDGEVREYPYGSLFAHIVGYSTKGKTGIEHLTNYYLINSDISLTEKAANEAAGRKNPGNNIYTTLHIDLQEKAKQAMGIYRGAIVVMEPKTGKVLAMVSLPDFDPNEIAYIWEEIIADTDSSTLLNRAVQGLYPPGSTFKIVTALEYMRENPNTWQSYTYQCSGSYTHGDNTIRCYHGSKHGTIDFGKSFAKSCNSSFANIGMSLDRGRYTDTIQSLLFNSPLPVDLPSSISQIQLDSDSDDEAMIQTVIGQGKSQITPVQLCMITSAIANKGMLMKPYEVERIENADGKVLKEYLPQQYTQLLTEEEAVMLGALMQDVVLEGTASKLSGLTYTAAGKTGSAEFNADKNDSHAWFTGFAPYEDPEIAITVIIEGAGSGGDYAVPIAKRVLDAYFSKAE